MKKEAAIAWVMYCASTHGEEGHIGTEACVEPALAGLLQKASDQLRLRAIGTAEDGCNGARRAVAMAELHRQLAEWESLTATSVGDLWLVARGMADHFVGYLSDIAEGVSLGWLVRDAMPDGMAHYDVELDKAAHDKWTAEGTPTPNGVPRFREIRATLAESRELQPARRLLRKQEKRVQNSVLKKLIVV